MAIDWEAITAAGGNGKPEPLARTKRRKLRQKVKTTAEIRVYVFGRERNICRCCRKRAANSMHEMRPRSLGGRVSKRNSIAVCGDGVQGCHGFLQRHEIDARPFDGGDEVGAEAEITFEPLTPKAAEWMQIRFGYVVESPVMFTTEIEP